MNKWFECRVKKEFKRGKIILPVHKTVQISQRKHKTRPFIVYWNKYEYFTLSKKEVYKHFKTERDSNNKPILSKDQNLIEENFNYIKSL